MDRASIARTAAVVLVALAVNIVLDVSFDLPVLARWGVALAVVILLTTLLEVARRRSTRRRLDRSPS
ncbi:hypothetical protein [Jannaschia sp. R86511]|uniref:hypothetical protein n=1 Tax=Jannaschia sp. R86511 TaxID=3093853 RepID=UPI0036D39559